MSEFGFTPGFLQGKRLSEKKLYEKKPSAKLPKNQSGF